jgi:hypothetical protein
MLQIKFKCPRSTLQYFSPLRNILQLSLIMKIFLVVDVFGYVNGHLRTPGILHPQYKLKLM